MKIKHITTNAVTFPVLAFPPSLLSSSFPPSCSFPLSLHIAPYQLFCTCILYNLLSLTTFDLSLLFESFARDPFLISLSFSDHCPSAFFFYTTFPLSFFPGPFPLSFPFISRSDPFPYPSRLDPSPFPFLLNLPLICLSRSLPPSLFLSRTIPFIPVSRSSLSISFPYPCL